MTDRSAAPPRLPADLREPFERLVADAEGEFGPTPLARLMSAHLPFFTALHRRGASWPQTADLLTARGIIGPSGPFTAGVVRATYARVCAAAATAANTAQRNEAHPIETKRNPRQQNVADRQSQAPETGAAHPNTAERIAPDRNAAPRNVVHRNYVDPDETQAALHRRAALLNRQNRRR